MRAGAIAACFAILSSIVSLRADAAPPGVQRGVWADGALATAVLSPIRDPKNVARDRYRHPRESLSFWGLRPGMTVLEIWPAKATGGRYIAAVESGGTLPAKFSDKSVYGNIQVTAFGKDSAPMVPPGSIDFVLTARNIHDWMPTPGWPEKAMRDSYAALKPGGILAVEQHRADPRPMKPDASDGYMSTASVVQLAEKAGFKLEDQSELNANPKDTKDHPFGVWTLPPTRQSAPRGQPPNPNFDHAKYDAIGESDRMTLKFRKPA